MGSLFEEYFEKGLAEGRVVGRAQNVLRVLTVRRVHMDDTVRQRVLSCKDLDTLGLWLDRAVTATHISDVFEDLKQ